MPAPNRLTAKYDSIRDAALEAIANDLGDRVHVCAADKTLEMIDDLDAADGREGRYEKVATEAAKLFQKGGYFEYCTDAAFCAPLAKALKEVGYL